MKLLVFLLCFAGLAGQLSQAEEKVETTQVFIDEVKETEIFDPVVFGGKIEAASQTTILSSVAGVITAQYKNIGEKVRKGQRLLTIAPLSTGLEFRPTTVVSTMDGILAELSLKVGAPAKVGEVVAVIVDPTVKIIRLSVPVIDVADFKVGTSKDIELRVPNSDEVNLINGKVLAVSPVTLASGAVQSVELELECKSDKAGCEVAKIGSFAKVTLRKNFRKGIKVVGKHLINQRQKAIIIDAKNQVKHVGVEVGKILGKDVEVLGGLTVGMKLVTSFSKFPKEGEIVEVKDIDAEKEKVYSDAGAPQKQGG